MDLKDLLNTKVSFQSSAWADISLEITIREVLDDIKSNKYFTQIDQLRNLLNKGEIDRYKIHKKQLPAVTFCGTFDGKRNRESLKEYNQLIVLDIDELEKEEIERVKVSFITDEYVLAFWESPSQNGIKGLVSLNFDFDLNKQSIDISHKRAFVMLKNYFADTYNIELDVSGSDTTRLCFFCHDPNLYLKSIVRPFLIEKVELEYTTDSSLDLESSTSKTLKKIGGRNALYNPKDKNNPLHRNALQSIIKYLTKHNLSITYSYEEWYRVAFGIANSFTYDLAEKYFLSLSKLDVSKYNEIDAKNMLMYAYENSKGDIKFATIVYLASIKGYQTKKTKSGSSEGG